MISDAQPAASPFEPEFAQSPSSISASAHSSWHTADMVVAKVPLTEIKRWILLGALSVVAALAFVFIGALFKAASPDVTAAIAIAAMVACFALAGTLLYRRERKAGDSLAARLSTAPRGAWSTMLTDTFTCLRHSPSSVLPRMASQLFSGGHGPFTIVAVNKELDALPPVNVPFEPIPLIESHPAFAMFLPVNTPNAANSATQSIKPDAAEWQLSVKRAVALVGGPWMASLLLFIVCMSIIDAIREWSIPESLWPWPLFVVILMLNATNCGAWSSYIQYFLVPGGVVVRWSNSMLRAQLHLRLCERDRAGLTIWQTNKHSYSLCLVNDDGRMQTSCTRNEAIAVLRAWFSDLEPPTVEQLSDLT